MAFFAEQAPANSSIVYTSQYAWDDGEWMNKRAVTQADREPDVDLRGAPRVVAQGQDLPSWPKSWLSTSPGRASPTWSSCRSPSTRSSRRGGYQVTNYFAPKPRLGRPDEFRHLVDKLHQARHRRDSPPGAR